MIIYNVTVSVDQEIAPDWLAWMKATHMPDVLATGCFTESRIFKVLGAEEQGGLTYAVQYMAKDMAAYERYQEQFAAGLQTDVLIRYPDRIAAFRTLLESV